MCARCGKHFHESCMARWNDEQSTQAGVRLPHQCPTCRVTYAELVAELTEPEEAPHGALCYVCGRVIERGSRMRRCANRRSVCVAMWHVECRASSVYGAPARCPACGCSMHDCIRNLRDQGLP